MADVSAKQQLKNYKKAMGDELGVTFHHCRQDFLFVTSLWDQFCTLFGNKERVELMNSKGELLAYNVHWQFLNGVVLGITRLLDPVKQGKHENLSLKRVVELCPAEIKDEAIATLNQLEREAEQLTDLRNKVIGHSDFEYATGAKAPADYASRNDITVLLKTTLALLNLVDVHFTKAPTTIIPMGNRDAFTHLLFLYRGARVKEEILAALSQNDLSPLQKYDLPNSLAEGEKEFDRYR